MSRAMPDYAPERRKTGSGFTGNPPTALGERLRQLRIKYGMTQRQLADQLNTKACRVSDWEMGIHQPTLTVLCRYAAALDTTVSAMLRGVL